MTRALIILLLLSLVGCTTFKTDALLERYDTPDEVIAAIGKPSYILDNRYVWRINSKIRETVTTATPYTTFTIKYINGHMISVPQTNYYYTSEQVDVIRNCELVLVADNDKKLIFREATGNFCYQYYNKALSNYLMNHQKLSKLYKGYDYSLYGFLLAIELVRILDNYLSSYY